MTITIDDYNNILTALYKERDRAYLENDERSLMYIQRTIDIVKNNTGIVKETEVNQ
jgi:hypothetical protein